MERISLTELIDATGGRPLGFDRRDIGFDTVGIDSRTIGAGDLFWALRGERHDGHDFAKDALARGAAACVVEEHRHRGDARPAVLVKDTLQALWDVASWLRRRRDAVVIGVTGSVGKTTTREMIHAALCAGLAGMRSPHNFNNQIGVPLSLLEIERHHMFAVLELGASRVGEIRELAALAAPQIGVVTAIAAAHLDGFGNEEQIARAKGELIEALPQSGIAILAGDDPQVRRLAERASCRVVFVGEHSDNDLRATEIDAAPNRLHYSLDGYDYEIPATGRHHLRAALCATAVAREFGLSPATIAAGLRQFAPAPGRCRLEEIGPWTVIDDTYNANPGSMQAACEILRTWDRPGRRILVTGDMLELGDRTEELHERLGRTAAASNIDYVLACGACANHVVRGATGGGMAASRLAGHEQIDSLIEALDALLEPADVLLVKGSRRMRMERIVNHLRNRAAQAVHDQSSNKDESKPTGRAPWDPLETSNANKPRLPARACV